MATKSSTTSYSDRDLEMLRTMHRCLKSKPDVDMEKFASESGLGGVKSARATLNRLLKKLSGEDEVPIPDVASPEKEAEGEETTQATPIEGKKKGGGRKRKTDTADGDETASPSKKKASPTKRKVKAEDEGAGGEEAA